MGIQLFQYDITFFDGRDKTRRIVVAEDVIAATNAARAGCDLQPGYRLYEIAESHRPAWCTTDDLRAPQLLSETALREYARRGGFDLVKTN